MNPFHDLGQRCGGPVSAAGVPSLPLSGPAAAASRLPDADTKIRAISFSRFACLLSLGVLGLVGLLSLGVGGVALVQGYAFPAAKSTRKLTGAVWHAGLSSRADAWTAKVTTRPVA